MKTLNTHEIIAAAICQYNKWAVYLNNSLDYDSYEWQFFAEQIREEYAHDFVDILYQSLILFNSEQEALDFYRISERGVLYASGLYAALYNPHGTVERENT